jgi:hypothetical protein
MNDLEMILYGDEILWKENENPWIKMSPEELDQMLNELEKRENEDKRTDK